MHLTATRMRTFYAFTIAVSLNKRYNIKKDLDDMNNLYLTYPRERDAHFACDNYVRTLCA